MPQFSLSSSTYKKLIFDGFSRLQQSYEFVDMTLAAEGHCVKVHQTIVALASPYLKELILSIPSRHPVIFLNGVSHENLSFLLEYIYRGEVEIPAEKVQSFLNTARAMHIAGLKNIPPTEDEKSSQENETTQYVNSVPRHPQPLVNANIMIRNENEMDLELQEPIIELPDAGTDNHTNSDLPYCDGESVVAGETNEVQNFRNINSCGKSINISIDDNASNDNISQKPVAKIEILSNTLLDQLPQLYTDVLASMKNQDTLINNGTNISMDNPASCSKMDISQLINIDSNLPAPQYNTQPEAVSLSEWLDSENSPDRTSNVNCTEEVNDIDKITDSILYTVSNRGALQLIMNRFLYYCHYKREHRRRWRCIDYRDTHCLAAIDTVGDQIVSRKHKHCHPNHDKKIRQKCSRSNAKFFNSIKMADDNIEKTRKS